MVISTGSNSVTFPRYVGNFQLKDGALRLVSFGNLRYDRIIRALSEGSRARHAVVARYGDN
jgi:hypothetical protein